MLLGRSGAETVKRTRDVPTGMAVGQAAGVPIAGRGGADVDRDRHLGLLDGVEDDSPGSARGLGRLYSRHLFGELPRVALVGGQEGPHLP